jgi:thiol-disulfide isomerase/thioredoxin
VSDDQNFLEEHAAEIADLPPDDPLHDALRTAMESRQVSVELDLDRLGAQRDELRETLDAVEVPPGLEIDLRAVAPAPGRRGFRSHAGWLAAVGLAAAVAVAFFVGSATQSVGPTQASGVGEVVSAPTVVALKFWHVTCPACEKIDPVYADVIQDFEGGEEVLFVTLDMSTEASRQQSRLLAGALGVEPMYDEMFGQTGFVVLLDGSDRRELGRLTTRHDANAMRGLIRGAISSARG